MSAILGPNGGTYNLLRSKTLVFVLSVSNANNSPTVAATILIRWLKTKKKFT